MKILLYASGILFIGFFAACSPNDVVQQKTTPEELVITDTAMTPIFIIKPEAMEPKERKIA
jgi:hypothetical protein